MHPCVHSSTAYNSQDMGTDQISINRGMDKEDGVYAYTHTRWNTTQTLKKWNHAICSSMEGPGDWHIKWSKTERQRHLSCDITHLWNLKGTYQGKRNRLTDIENRLVLAKGEGRIGSLGWADEIYFSIERLKSELLQYGTGDPIQHLAKIHKGKEYVGQAESICYTVEMNHSS